MNKLIVISGCSGGGKSTLLAELEKLGFAVIPEVATDILREQIASGGYITPWKNPEQFCHLMVERSVEAYHSAKRLKADKGVVFLDRGILDGVRYFKILEQNEPDKYDHLLRDLRYYSEVFITPPWNEIYVCNDERKHSFETAARDYEGLLSFYKEYEYQIKIIPKSNLEERAQFVVSAISQNESCVSQIN